MVKTRCPVCGKMVEKKRKTEHIRKEHPKSYPIIDETYKETYQSGGAIARKTEANKQKRESRR